MKNVQFELNGKEYKTVDYKGLCEWIEQNNIKNKEIQTLNLDNKPVFITDKGYVHKSDWEHCYYVTEYIYIIGVA